MLSFLSRGLAAAIAVVMLGNLPISLSIVPQSISKFLGSQAFAAQTDLVAQTSTKPLPQPIRKTDNSLTADVVKTVLDNGLTVLTKQVNTAPVVSVQVWYRVGSQNETKGITGISHQLEHLMFKGTKERPIQFGRLFSALGSNSNAFTSYDMTAYVGTAGSDKLDAMLRLEADRMVNTVAGEKELKSERTVVLSELDGGNNSPGTRLYRQVMLAAYPDSPYGWPVIGYRPDVENFTVEDIQNYYHNFYRPDNATLVIVGNIDTEETIKKVQEIFGTISAPPKPKVLITAEAQQKKPKPPAPKSAKEPIRLKEPGSVPFLQSLYPNLPKVNDPDVAAIDVMDSVLTSGRSSRLYQALVETGLASGVSGSSASQIGTGWYLLSATPTQGKSLEDLDRLLLAEIDKLQTQSISQEELDRAKTNMRASYILGNRDINSQAIQIGYNQTLAQDYRYSDRYLQAVDKVTIADVKRVAKQYLASDRRVVGYFEPSVITAGAGTTPSNAHSSEAFKPSAPVDPAEVAKYLPESALVSKSEIPTAVNPDKFTLSNGLKVLLLRDRSTPTVNLVGEIKAGSGFDSLAKAGLAGLTAQNLTNGTTTKDALTLASRLENLGARLGFSAGRESVGISGISLSKDLPTVIDQLADLLQNATFPEKEFELNRQRNLLSLKSELDNPNSLARRIFQSAIYPQGHPFSAMRTEESIKSLTREDLAQFYRTYYRPDNTILTITGDFEPATVRMLLEEKLGSWQATGKAPKFQFPKMVKLAATTEKQATLAGKTQAVTLMGHSSISRSDPQYYPAIFLNQVLGGDTLSSRLGSEIRDRLGLTYGIYSFFQAGRPPQGAFIVQMQTSGKDTQKAIAATLALLRDVRDKGITQAEFDVAKKSLINNFTTEFADPDSITSALLSDEIYGLPVGDFYKFPQRIQSITLEQVNRAAKELLQPDNMLIVSVVPKTDK
ncbi:insulinase family protein [Pseudanabaena sp. FACHB-1998]|uniref:M16 family metallopeptidase n=1 Tax=Pseudanabaena sp. FACHB-1998 TaxID=2692858 RepID=UPI00168061C9|nr:pitrilysin family protein [Pseudanabaena sp. FACHB-1998]MBD2175761.1 insulinase family protein [Pseudanabaena sp. FACHB-1998]